MSDASTAMPNPAIRDAVRDLNGVGEVNFVGGGVIVTFNPIGITNGEICTAIRRSGYRATEITTRPGRQCPAGRDEAVAPRLEAIRLG